MQMQRQSLRNLLLAALVGTMLASTGYLAYAESQKGAEARMDRYRRMSAEEMAGHLAEANAVPERLDAITLHAGTEAKGRAVYLYRELMDSLLTQLVLEPEAIEGEKARLTRQLYREMCDSPTYDLFYEKGGELHYVYHAGGAMQRRFLFEVKIDRTVCL